MSIAPAIVSLLAASSPGLPTLRIQETLRAPDGWRAVSMKGGQLGFAPEGLAKGKLVGIIVWPEEAASGDLEAWFRKKAPTMGAKGGKFQAAERIVFTSGASNGRPFILAAVRPVGKDDRARVAMYTSDANEMETYAKDFSEFLRRYSRGEASVSSGKSSTSRGGGTKAAGPDPKPDPKWSGLPASDPGKPLPAASLNGAKVYIVYENGYGMSGMTVTTDPMILFPDGTAFDDGPSKPIAAFDVAHVAAATTKWDKGRWTITGDRLTTVFPTSKGQETTVYRRLGEGWTDDPKATASSAWNVYRRAVPAPVSRLQGEWRTSSLTTMGMAGGGTPMVSAGSSGTLVFRGNRFANSTQSFASATTSNMGDAFKSGDVTTSSSRDGKAGGRYRLDGILMTREQDGRRGIELCFLMPRFDGPEPKTFYIGGDRYNRPEK